MRIKCEYCREVIDKPRFNSHWSACIARKKAMLKAEQLLTVEPPQKEHKNDSSSGRSKANSANKRKR